MLFIYSLVYDHTRTPQYKHTHSAERSSIKTDKTERFTSHWSRQS